MDIKENPGFRRVRRRLMKCFVCSIAAFAVIGLLVLGVLNGTFDPSVEGKMMVIYSRSGKPFEWDGAKEWGFGKANRHGGRSGLNKWAGMFSEVTSVLGALHYAEVHGAAGVRINQTSDLYLDPKIGPNWWSYFFEDTVMMRDDVRNPEEVHFNEFKLRLGRFGGFGPYIYGDSSTRPWYPVKYRLNRHEVNRIIRKYVRVKPIIMRQVNKFQDDHFKDADFVLTMHYRGTDNNWHYPYQEIQYDIVYEKIEEVLTKNVGDKTEREKRKWVMFVATDSIEFLEDAKKRYGSHVVYWKNVPRVHEYDNAIHFNWGAAKSNFIKGESALIDCILLASGDYLIKLRSSISDVSVTVNPVMNYTMILGNNEVYDVSAPLPANMKSGREGIKYLRVLNPVKQ